ncbi:MAG: hypothetical protein BWY96_02224 [Spirochaetes bacterium ADurb.BinA120]|nr:MAG: hypothetical protein BWY96_02224 [Spirochaetes bacterium ADurb.BinA120]
MDIKGIFRRHDKPRSPAVAAGFAGDIPDFIDREKFGSMTSGMGAGIRNYLLFQRFPSYRYPDWINRLSDGASRSGGCILPPLLSNHSSRDWMYFTNLLSSDALRIDRSGMLSPTYAAWSVEIWVLIGQRLFRAQESPAGVVQERDPLTSIARTTWREKEFGLVQTVFGARTGVDEAIVALDCSLPRKTDGAKLLVVFRPYDPLSIGTMREIEYRRDARTVKIDGVERAALETRPDFIATGNGVSGDIVPAPGARDMLRSSCEFGMATLALGYALEKGSRRIHIRINLSRGNPITASRVNFTRAAAEFIEFAGIRIKSGLNLAFPDDPVVKWLYATKLCLLNSLNRESQRPRNPEDIAAMRRSCLMVCACDRMGYHSEAEGMLRSLMPMFGGEAEGSFERAIGASYLLSAFADCFIHSRDMEFLRKGYSSLKSTATGLFEHARTIKSASPGRGANSLGYYLDASSHPYDKVLLYNALRQYSYLARCMGLFGDENRFAGEARRLGGLVAAEIGAMFPAGEERDGPAVLDGNVAAGYIAAAGYPFRVEELGADNLRSMVAGIAELYGGVPLYVRALGGWDSVLSLLFASNLIHIRDMRYYDLMGEFMQKGGERYSLQDVLHPGSGAGMMGDGDSVEAMAAFALTLRNMLFMDFESRLDVLPSPREEWFIPGSEMVVQDAPSRFGPISFRVLSSSGDVQFRFTDLPKFVPPEIMINLPFRAKIKQESDFVIKKDFGNAVTINGWPEIVKFSR